MIQEISHGLYWTDENPTVKAHMWNSGKYNCDFKNTTVK